MPDILFERSLKSTEIAARVRKTGYSLVMSVLRFSFRLGTAVVQRSLEEVSVSAEKKRG